MAMKTDQTTEPKTRCLTQSALLPRRLIRTVRKTRRKASDIDKDEAQRRELDVRPVAT